MGCTGIQTSKGQYFNALAPAYTKHCMHGMGCPELLVECVTLCGILQTKSYFQQKENKIAHGTVRVPEYKGTCVHTAELCLCDDIPYAFTHSPSSVDKSIQRSYATQCNCPVGHVTHSIAHEQAFC